MDESTPTTCAACGAPANPGDVFCGTCGKRVTPKRRRETPAPAPSTPEPVSPKPAPTKPAPPARQPAKPTPKPSPQPAPTPAPASTKPAHTPPRSTPKHPPLGCVGTSVGLFSAAVVPLFCVGLMVGTGVQWMLEPDMYEGASPPVVVLELASTFALGGLFGLLTFIGGVLMLTRRKGLMLLVIGHTLGVLDFLLLAAAAQTAMLMRWYGRPFTVFDEIAAFANLVLVFGMVLSVALVSAEIGRRRGRAERA